MNKLELFVDPWLGPGFDDDDNTQPRLCPYLNKFSWQLEPVIDWVSFTILNAQHVSAFFKLFKILDTDFVAAPRGRLGYLSMLVHRKYSGFQLLYDGRPGMGVHVDISGEAVPYFLASARDSGEIFKIIRENGCNVTRLDLSVDDVGAMFFSTLDVLELIENKQIVSRSKKYSSTIKRTMLGDWRGHTVYIGSRSSEAMLRVYDKAAEVLGDDADKYDFKLAWTRWELELKGGKALDASKYLCEAGPAFGQVCYGALSSFLRFIQLDATRRERCSTLPLWDDFLGGVKRLEYAPKMKTPIDSTRDWLLKSASKGLVKVLQADGDLEFIHNLLRVGQERLKKADRKQIEQYELMKDREYLCSVGVPDDNIPRCTYADTAPAVYKQWVVDNCGFDDDN